MSEEIVKCDNGVSDWETGLPSSDDITPLNQSLIPPELASAFKISPEPPRTTLDVDRASQTTLSSLCSAFNFESDDQLMAEEGESEPKKSRRMDPDESAIDNCGGEDSSSAKKRPRLVWTPQLHKRFVDVVAHLGLKNAVPKTIMQLMNVEGLTRENVASHLQKYRLYVKRMQGFSSNEGPSLSDHLFASTPLHSFSEPSSSGSHGNGSHGNSNQIPMPYPPPIIPMPTMGNVNSANGYEAGNSYHHYHHHHHHYQSQYSNMVQQQQRDWSGNKFNNTYSHQVTQNNQ